MKRFINFIIRKSIKNSENIRDQNVRTQYGILEGWVTTAVNLVISGIKLLFGLLTNSLSLIADAVHSAADMVTSILIVVGFKMAAGGADEEHPFGRGRYEAIVGVIVAVLLVVTGVEFARGSIERMIHPSDVQMHFTWLAFITVLLSLVPKEFSAQFGIVLGKKIHSPALIADGMHSRSDVIATIFVLFSMIFYELLPQIRRIVPVADTTPVIIDAAAGLIVAGFIIFTGVEIIQDAIKPLIGEPPDPETLAQIKKIVEKHRYALGCHDIVLNQYGSVMVGSVHVEMPEKLSLTQAHTIAEQIENNLRRALRVNMTVHIDPINNHHPKYKSVQKDAAAACAADKRIESFHDLRIIGTAEQFNIVFDVVPVKSVTDKEYSEIKSLLRKSLRARYKSAGIVIELEPRYAY